MREKRQRECESSKPSSANHATDIDESAPPVLPISVRISQYRLSLTRAHQKIADFVQAHPLRVATMPVDQLAKECGVSIATANRFAKAIGLDGYARMRSDLVQSFASTLAPVEKLRLKIDSPSTTHEVFAAALQESERNIAATRNALRAADCDAAVTAIFAARRIYLVGFGASGWLIGLLQRGLDVQCQDVRSLSGVAGASYGARFLAQMDQRDLVIVLCFPRYLTDTVMIAKAASEKGVPILALTDSPRSPLQRFASICLYAQTENHYAPNSDSTALAMIEALCSAVAQRAQRPVMDLVEVTEAVLPWLYQGQSNRLDLGPQDTSLKTRVKRLRTRR